MSKSSSSSSLSPQSVNIDWRTVFDKFCKSTYIEESQLYSETVCKEIGERVMHLLKGKPSPAMEQDPFHVWVKTKGFALTSYPLLGLREVLCVPSTNTEPYQGGDGSISWRRVGYIEDFHSIITKFHIKPGEHLSAVKTHFEVCKHYAGIPMLAVNKYVELCPVCKSSLSSSSKPSVDETAIAQTGKKNNFMKKGQVEVIDIIDKPLGPFPHICLYIDMYSNYHIIFPLTSSSSSSSSSTPHNMNDIAANLRKYVFPYFGMPRRLCSSMGSSFVDSLLEATCIHWPDAVAIRNGSKKNFDNDHVHKRARKSKSLISDLFESCRSELEDVQWTPSACSDLLLSLQYQLNTSTSKKNTRKSPYELVFGTPPLSGPLNHQHDIPTSSDEDETPPPTSLTKPSQLLDDDNITVQRNSLNDMNRLIHKSSGQQPSQQLQQMLNRTSSIQAQEQQVSSLRELLRQEESRLELLKKMRQPNNSTSGGGPLKETQQRKGGGVIRSGETTVGHHLNNGSQSNISVRLQQLVDSVAVDQMGTGTKYGINNHTSLTKSDAKSVSPEVITISDSPSPASPPALISTVPGVIHGPSSGQKIDESLVMKTIESSRKYREFVVKQNNVKRNFQKQMDKKISSFSYPKTFRQVWPIIPVQDPSFVKNLGLETVTQFFEQSSNPKSSGASKVKPICNQCGCDFASAWQIRKNNSKQVLLCEACDFTNLKLLQRTKLATQLKEVVESVKREEEKFNGETEEARKQLIAVERVAVISQKANSLPQQQQTARTITDRITDTVIPSIISGKTTTTTIHDKPSAFSSSIDRKRRLEPSTVPVPSKAPKTHLDHTLNRITQQLLLKQVDEKVHQQRHRDTPSPIPPPTRSIITKKTPPPLVEEKDVVVVNHTTHLSKKTPPPLTSSTPSSTDSRRSRRKGQPRQNVVMLNNSDV